MEEEQDVKVSKYNSAIAQLYRLDDLWKKAHSFCLAGMLIKWNWVLDRVWCELASDAAKDEKTQFNDFVQKIVEVKQEQDSEKLYFVLLEKEIFLRGVQNREGKGSAYSDENEDMFE
jgi:hypothetical protein